MSGWLLCTASRFDDFVLAENLTGLLSSEGRLNFFGPVSILATCAAAWPGAYGAKKPDTSITKSV